MPGYMLCNTLSLSYFSILIVSDLPSPADRGANFHPLLRARNVVNFRVGHNLRGYNKARLIKPPMIIKF